MKRSRIKPKPRDLEAEVAWQALREAIYERAEGRCESCGVSLDQTGMEAAHRVRRGVIPDSVVNLTACCPRCHRLDTEHPAEARLRGFVAATWDDPAGVALHHWYHGWVLLTADGGYEPVDAPEATE